MVRFFATSIVAYLIVCCLRDTSRILGSIVLTTIFVCNTSLHRTHTMNLFASRRSSMNNTVWIDRTLDGNMEGTAAGLLDECILDDDEGKCEKFSNALAKLDSLLGVTSGEQF